MKLTEYLSQSSVIVPMRATEKASAISELVHALTATGKLTDPAELLEAVMQREAVRSTGIGNGLAIPHGKSKACTDLLIAVGKLQQPIPFGAIDNRPVWLIVLLGAPPEHAHIQALAKVSRMLMVERNRQVLQKTETSEEMYTALAEADAAA